MDTNETLAAYDALAQSYSEYSSQRSAYLDAIDQLVIDNLKPNMRLLDIGVGDGRRLTKIKTTLNLKECVAIEPSAEMAKICRKQTGITVYETTAEKLDELDIGKFDAVIALWNVFGHITSSENRRRALKNIMDLLEPEGLFILDVNNRHNAISYGFFKVAYRIILDALLFNEVRGDAKYEWKIGGQVFQGAGHLFTANEIESLFFKSNLKVIERFSLNYRTGKISNLKYLGQLFYILSPS